MERVNIVVAGGQTVAYFESQHKDCEARPRGPQRGAAWRWKGLNVVDPGKCVFCGEYVEGWSEELECLS